MACFMSLSTAKVISGVRSIRTRSGAPCVICSIRHATRAAGRQQFEALDLAQYRFQAFCQDRFVAIKKNSRHSSPPLQKTTFNRST